MKRNTVKYYFSALIIIQKYLFIDVTRRYAEPLESFRRFERNIILDAVKTQLPHQPLQETRNRKLLRANPLADWELRVQNYRVFYEVDPENPV